MFTADELKNVLVLISRANISGNEALGVAQLQMKISSLINSLEQPPEAVKEVKKEKTDGK